MAINLKAIEPHKVSKDFSGSFVYLYGPGGAGKTSTACMFPKPLLLAFEIGYNAIAGIRPQPISTWGEMKQVLRQLDDPEVKEMYSTIIVDTVDRASICCEKYICNQLDIENIGDGGWSANGWSKVKKEWENTFNSVAHMGYTIVFISHSKDKTFTRKDGSQYNQVVPSCPNTYNEIIRNMVDIEGYIDNNNGTRSLILRSNDDSVECKSRYKYIEPVIALSYDSLLSALNKAIEAEINNKGSQYLTTEKIKAPEIAKYDYDALITEFQNIVGELMNKDQQINAPKITQIVEKYLGKGKKVAETNRDQAEFIYLIVSEIKEDLM